MSVPLCYNRPRYTGMWMRAGYRGTKPVLRWVEHCMSDRCAAWDAPNGAIPEPLRANWNCAGCRWLPHKGEVAMALAETLKRLGRPRAIDM